MQHIPVMAQEVLEYLKLSPSSVVLDLTVGAAGHFTYVAEAIGNPEKMIGVDRDLMCITEAKKKFPSSTLIHGSWTQALTELEKRLPEVQGVLMDCGVSSMQLDHASRGFSFRFDAPLDMRMDTTQAISAQNWLSSVDEQTLANTLFHLADERRSRRIAKSIVEKRRKNQLHTTFDLVQAVEDAVGPKRGKTHPATKTFQAVRMAVNEELIEIEKTLQALIQKLSHGARIVVITFHSIEDRLVKNIFRDAKQNKQLRLLHKKAVRPQREEYLLNQRARSATIRAVEIVKI
ncbi:MAG: 16S rRNA (cytosine(1402)-N(4))-methyltransferase RsmH [Bdellovibrionales bacterium]|nr:16S rRNA (cytosine(1402)-N(4))-methyltransferase RsmH [Bdellovibrionales bacterium]